MVSIIVPCYNEKDNVSLLIKRLEQVLVNNGIDGEIIIVDDDSPDGTSEAVLKIKERYNNLEVIIRKDEKGLGTAVVEGFKKAKGEILVVMDADLSHPPETIPALIAPIKDGICQIAIGSRYVEGGRIEGMPLSRLIISRITSYIGRLIVKVSDPFTGFFALKRSIIENMPLRPKGFKIGFEIIIKGSYKRIIEIPYIFQNRKYGKSKLTNRIMIENILHFLYYLLYRKPTRAKV